MNINQLEIQSYLEFYMAAEARRLELFHSHDRYVDSLERCGMTRDQARQQWCIDYQQAKREAEWASFQLALMSHA